MIDSPVFLVGAERSGTTLLRLMLSHHPRIAFLNEFEIVVDKIAPDGTLPDRRTFVAHLEQERSFQLKKLAIAPDLDFLALANDLLEQVRAAKGTPVAVVGATVHRHFERLLLIWPDARFIHLVRDGRDVALSNIPMGWAGNLYTGIRRWVEAETAWSRLEARLPADRRVALTYEDLLTDPPKQLARLCRFLGLDNDEAMLRYDETTSYQKPSTRSIGKWRKADRRAIAAAESRAAPWLEKNGYALSTTPRPVGRARALRYRMQDRWARMRFGQKRYSLRLWLANAVSARVGGARWRADVRRRVHEITNRHLH